MSMRKAHRIAKTVNDQRREWSERQCWRCGEKVGPTFGDAVLVVAYTDDSYTGAWHLPLCDACLVLPHQSAAMPRLMHDEAGGWLLERLRCSVCRHRLADDGLCSVCRR